MKQKVFELLSSYRYHAMALGMLAFLVLMTATATPAAADGMQVPTLAVNSTIIQTGLFEGANIILVALGSIFFLLIGFAFGGKILNAIGSFIQRFSF